MSIHRFWVRNGLALAALMLAIYLPDHYAVGQRSGWWKWAPYIFVLLLYGWIVFHNRILFERFFERGKRREYIGWLLLGLVVGTLNMTLIVRYGFGLQRPVEIILKFYIYTITGLGVYITYRELFQKSLRASPVSSAVPTNIPPDQRFIITTDSGRRELDPAHVRYVESLENYVRVVMETNTLVTRLTMKQVEEQLHGAGFVRISRSHIINPRYVVRQLGDQLDLGSQTLRIGRTYKQHVAERLKQPLNESYLLYAELPNHRTAPADRLARRR